MSFLVFPARGGGKTTQSAFPFQIIVENSRSGIAKEHFDSKCPCESGSNRYTSSYFYQPIEGYPVVLNSGLASFKIYSGSTLYADINFSNKNYINASGQNMIRNSYVGDTLTETEGYAESYAQNSPCTMYYKNQSVIPIAGLNRSIFIKDFTENIDTIKIWLSVCFPSSEKPTDGFDDEIKGRLPTIWDKLVCLDCSGRANYPMQAVISCGESWPQPLVNSYLVNKSLDTARPRLEQRQVAAYLPIGEINRSGVVTKQYINDNVTLVDMCLNGCPSKYPVSLFSEY